MVEEKVNANAPLFVHLSKCILFVSSCSFITFLSSFSPPPPLLSLISLTSIIFITGKIAEEVLLSVKVAVYFLFLQLYSLYPCSFVQYLKGRFGPTGEVHIYQEHIAVSKRERERQRERREGGRSRSLINSYIHVHVAQ